MGSTCCGVGHRGRKERGNEGGREGGRNPFLCGPSGKREGVRKGEKEALRDDCRWLSMMTEETKRREEKREEKRKGRRIKARQ